MKLERNAVVPIRGLDIRQWAMGGVLLLLWLVLAMLPATRGAFLSEGNLATMMTQMSHVIVIAVGMTLVIVIRGIDLSVGAGVALTGVVAAMLQIDYGMPAWIAVGAAVAAGAVLGLWQGLWIARFGIPAFIVTLAGFNAYRGVGLVMSHSRGLSPMRQDFQIFTDSLPPAATIGLIALGVASGVALLVRDATRRRTHKLTPVSPTALGARCAALVALGGFLLAVFGSRGMPVPVFLAACVVLLGVAVMRKTRFGRHVYAIGGNPEAARMAGIDVQRTTMWVYIFIGLLTGLAGAMLAGRVNGVTPGSQGQLLELDVISAVVIGGTSLAGGRGSVVGTLLGAMVFGTIANGMNLLEVDSNWQLILKGLILLAAALIDVLLKRRSA